MVRTYEDVTAFAGTSDVLLPVGDTRRMVLHRHLAAEAGMKRRSYLIA